MNTQELLSWEVGMLFADWNIQVFLYSALNNDLKPDRIIYISLSGLSIHEAIAVRAFIASSDAECFIDSSILPLF